MHVAITGSNGLIGTALSRALVADGHTVTPVVRREPGPGEIRWDPAGGSIDADGLRAADAVVHLAGVGIADSRWTDEHKRAVVDSRVDGTTLLARTLADLDDGPKVLLSSSAIGFYGDTGDTAVDESAPAGDDWLAEVCVKWEEAAQPAVDAGLRVAYLRTVVVQSVEGGALKKQLLPFKLGLGGRIGSGRQYVSWITMQDEVAAIVHLLGAEVSGPVNLTAPEPVTNAEYTKALGEVLGRPTLLPVPKLALKAILGSEAADALAFGSQRVLPTRLTDSGFVFAHPEVVTGLRAVLS